MSMRPLILIVVGLLGPQLCLWAAEPVQVQDDGDADLDIADRLRREREQAVARILAPPPTGPRNRISLTAAWFQSNWTGDAGSGSGAPSFEDAFETGSGLRIRSAFTLLPTVELGAAIGAERQRGDTASIDDVQPWSVTFESRTMVHALIEARLPLPLGLYRSKWFSTGWAGLQEGLIPSLVFRVGALYHPGVRAWIDDPAPPEMVHVETPYYSPSVLTTWEWAFGLQYRHLLFEVFVELGYRYASRPVAARGSLLTNGSGRMGGYLYSVGLGARF